MNRKRGVRRGARSKRLRRGFGCRESIDLHEGK